MRTDTLTKAAPSRQSGPRMSHGIYSRRFRHGVTWYIRYFIAGREVKERVGREADGFTKSKAKAALQSRLGDIAQGKFRLPTVRKPVLFRTLVARYREHAEAHHRGYRASRYTLNQLEAEFGTMPATFLAARSAAAMADTRRSPPAFRAARTSAARHDGSTRRDARDGLEFGHRAASRRAHRDTLPFRKGGGLVDASVVGRTKGDSPLRPSFYLHEVSPRCHRA